MLQVSISGTMLELSKVFAFLATLPPDTLVNAEPTDGPTHHVTDPLLKAPAAAPQTGAFQPAAATTQAKVDRRRKEHKNAQSATEAAAGGPFGNGATAQPAAQPAGAPFGNGQPQTQPAGVPTLVDVQAAMSAVIGRGKGGFLGPLMANFNATAASEVPEHRRAEFVAQANSL